MNTDQINAFLDVYHAGNFVTVAKARNVAPSSITRSIAALETHLQTRLFQRTTRSLTPTKAGEEYYQRMLPIMEAFSDAHESMASQSNEVAGRLRVAASVSYGQIILTPKLKAFRETYPNIQLELILSDNRIDLVTDKIDVAIRHGTLADSSLIARKLNDVSYHLVASPSYLAAHEMISAPYDLNAHTLINFPYESFRDEWHFERESQSEKVQINPAMTISNANAIRLCTVDGLGVALLADWTISDDIHSGRLVRLLPNWTISGKDTNSSTWILYPSNRYIPLKTKAFVEFLTQT